MANYGFLLDAKRCIECRACEVACKQWHGVETGLDVRYRRVRTVDLGRYPNVRVQALSIACNHCENALCIKACPVKAISRRADGLVLVDRNACVGCGECAQFCPYDAPQINARSRKMEKCTFCADRIDAGMEPACVTMCPTGALQWGNWADIAVRGEVAVEGFNNPALTKPRIRFVTAEWGVK